MGLTAQRVVVNSQSDHEPQVSDHAKITQRVDGSRYDHERDNAPAQNHTEQERHVDNSVLTAQASRGSHQPLEVVVLSENRERQ